MKFNLRLAVALIAMSLWIAPLSLAKSAPLKLVKKTSFQKSDKPRYEISIHYPELTGYPDKNVSQNFNSRVRTEVEELGRNFKEAVADVSEDSEEGLRKDFPDMTSTLVIRYEIVHQANDIISVHFTEIPYYSGAAHPGHETLTLNYDLKKNQNIEFRDLFKKGSDYLDFISKYCIEELLKKSDGEKEVWFLEGAAPKPENYQLFNISDKGLMITFNTYQVAPYAVGPQFITIPYTNLNLMIDSQGPLGYLTDNSGKKKK